MRNKFEKEIYKQLCQKYGKDNVEYEPHQLDYYIHGTYTPDFAIYKDRTGEVCSSPWYVETKGYFRPQTRRLMKAVRLENKDIDLRLIFYRDAKLYKDGKAKYSDWAEQEGFRYGIGHVPKDW